MNGASLNIVADRIEKLKAEFPEIFTEGKIDLEKFKATFSDDINLSNERYVLNWAGKSDAFKVLQIPTTATLKPQPKESVNFDTTAHIFIEGENLEVLKVLQKSYYGKIKCIIIDPPYNTGSDSFIYPDSFKENKEEYQKRIGEKDEEGYLMKEGMFRKNSKDSGHYHSNWLSMMYPRLFLAKNLLREDGVIFVHIDDNEVHNLRMVMNEIFGEENLIEQIIWKKRYGGGAKEKYLVNLHEYILMYSKEKSKLDPIFISNNQEFIQKYYSKKDNKFEERGPYRLQPLEAAKSMGERKNLVYKIPGPEGDIFPKRQWLWSKERVLTALKNDELEFNKDREGNWTINIKQYLRNIDGNEKELKVPSIIEGIYTQHGTRDIEDLFFDVSFFSYPKPAGLIKYLLKFSINESDIVLDFFAGSGTTAQAVLELNKEDGGNRKFILVQLPELCDESSEAYKAGYKTIADIGKERIRRVIKKIEAEQIEEKKKKAGQIDFGNEEQKQLDLGFKSFKLSPSNFKIWRGSEITEENLVQQLDAFTNPVREGSIQEHMLYELMLKMGYPLTALVQEYGIQNDSAYEEENFNSFIYLVNDGELILALDKVNEQVVQAILNLQPQKVIVLDHLFSGNDQLKTNTVLQMKDAGIDFKTI
jgi:adenine-specific DNA-methyltransferase